MSESSQNTAQEADTSDIERFRALGTVVYYTSLISHCLLIYIFDVMGQGVLSLFNIGSVIVISAAILAHSRGRLYLGFFLYAGEIAAHAVAATMIMGWETGYFVYLTIPLMIMAFLPNASQPVKLIISIGFFSIMVVTIFASFSFGAMNPVSLELRDKILIGNFIVLSVVNGIFMFMFNRTIKAVEGKLIETNNQLQRFAGAVSEFLDPLLVGKLCCGADVSPKLYPLTVLFSDLAGSTRLSQEMDQTAYGAMIDVYAGTMHDIIKQHGGYVEDISGDGILAYIGNMGSQGAEADARAVVSMAIEMQRMLAQLNDRFAAEYDLPRPLVARIGISSGDGYVGKTSGIRSVYTANGACVNHGAKLEQGLKQLTNLSGILISDRTKTLIGKAITAETQEVTIDGAPVQAFTVPF